jgi:hypothetical protein
MSIDSFENKLQSISNLVLKLESRLNKEALASKQSQTTAEYLATEFGKTFDKYISGFKEDPFGPLACIPVENFDKFEADLRSVCEETVRRVVAVVEPIDTTECFEVMEAHLARVSLEIKDRVNHLDKLPQIAFQMSADHANPAILEEFQSLYLRGASESLGLLREEVSRFNEALFKRNQNLKTLQNSGTMTDNSNTNLLGDNNGKS